MSRITQNIISAVCVLTIIGLTYTWAQISYDSGYDYGVASVVLDVTSEGQIVDKYHYNLTERFMVPDSQGLYVEGNYYSRDLYVLKIVCGNTFCPVPLSVEDWTSAKVGTHHDFTR